MEYKFIRKIGIELEGGWFLKQLLPFVTWEEERQSYVIRPHHDASLQTSEFSPKFHVGELVSEALPPEEAVEWMLGHYPSSQTVRCGLHVHASFQKTEYYQALMCQEFHDFFLTEFLAWGEDKRDTLEPAFWERVEGRNRYCHNKFVPEQQLHLTNKNPMEDENGREYHPRRAALNYCWAMHRTIECRLLPMFHDPKFAESAVRKLFEIYEGWLGKNFDKVSSGRSVTLSFGGGAPRIQRREPRPRIVVREEARA